MPLSPETRRLVQQALSIRDSEVPLHRVMDILATDDGDISRVINRFRDIREPQLRRAFHNCAVLLRQIEADAGLAPTWQESKPASTPAPRAAAPAADDPPAKSAKPLKGAFSPDELKPFEDQTACGSVKIAKLYTDGASKGNPGKSGIGAVLYAMDGRKVGQLSQSLGIATNNQAEYAALLEGLRMAHRLGITTVFAFSDSELMVKQIKGVYRVKDLGIQKQIAEARTLIRDLEKFSITWIERAKNAMADALSTASIPKPPKPPRKSTGTKASKRAVAEDTEDILGAVEEDPDEGYTE